MSFCNKAMIAKGLFNLNLVNEAEIFHLHVSSEHNLFTAINMIEHENCTGFHVNASGDWHWLAKLCLL